MAKKTSFVEGLLITLAAIGGLFLFAEYYKKHTIRKIYYHCPKCDVRVLEDENPCHNCNTKIKWE